MPPDRRKSPLLDRSQYAARPREIARSRAHKLFNSWVAGRSYAVLASTYNLQEWEVRKIIKNHLSTLWIAETKWRRAEVRCHALAMELRLLRLGEKAEPDYPIEDLKPPEYWLKAFKAAGIETVYQLRAVDTDMLLANWRFPAGAIDWAIMKLDKLKLSHALARPKRVRTAQRNGMGKSIIR